jgi:hypothetical protein
MYLLFTVDSRLDFGSSIIQFQIFKNVALLINYIALIVSSLILLLLLVTLLLLLQQINIALTISYIALFIL